MRTDPRGIREKLARSRQGWLCRCSQSLCRLPTAMQGPRTCVSILRVLCVKQHGSGPGKSPYRRSQELQMDGNCVNQVLAAIGWPGVAQFKQKPAFFEESQRTRFQARRLRIRQRAAKKRPFRLELEWPQSQIHRIPTRRFAPSCWVRRNRQPLLALVRRHFP